MDRRVRLELGEGHGGRLEPGAGPDHYHDFIKHFMTLCRDLESQERDCTKIQHLLSQIQDNDQSGAIADLSSSIDAFLSEFSENQSERELLQDVQLNLQRKLADAENRSIQLQLALDRAAAFDNERLNALEKAERSRQQLQAELGESRCRISELEQIQQNQLAELSDARQQAAQLRSSLEALRRDHHQVLEANRQTMEQNRQATQQISNLQSDLDRLNQRHSTVERDNIHLNQAVTLAKHSQMALESELSQIRRQLQQSDKMLASTQKSLDKAVELRRKKEKEAVVLEKKVQERDGQISKLCGSLRQLRAFFHAYVQSALRTELIDIAEHRIENMDAANAGSDPSAAPKKPFQFGRILQELDKLSTTVEGL